jgi:hypothetical protein
MHATCFTHNILLDYISLITFSEFHHEFLQPPVTSPFSGPNIFLSPLFSKHPQSVFPLYVKHAIIFLIMYPAIEEYLRITGRVEKNNI